MYKIIIYVMINLEHFFFSHTMVLCMKIIYIGLIIENQQTVATVLATIRS